MFTYLQMEYEACAFAPKRETAYHSTSIGLTVALLFRNVKPFDGLLRHMSTPVMRGAELDIS